MQLMDYIKNITREKSFISNVMVLMSGTILAQIMSFLASPFLTRIYTPDDFGLLALFTSTSAIITVIAAGKYEPTIMLPNEDEEAINIVFLINSINIIICLVLITISIMFPYTLLGLLPNQKILQWLPFIPICAFLSVLSLSLQYWFNRRQRYKILMIGTVLSAFITISCNIILGLMRVHYGQILGLLFGYTGYIIFLILYMVKNDWQILRQSSWEKILYYARIYKKYPLFSIPADLINGFANQLPIFLITKYFTSSQVGTYSLTQRVLNMPLVLISRSVTDVFKERSSRDYRNHGNCRKIFVKTFISLILISLLPFGILYICGPWLFSFVFGEQWRDAGMVARFLSVMFIFRFIASPLGYVLYVAQKQKYDLIWQIILLCGSYIALVQGVLNGNFHSTILYYSLFYAGMYIFYIGLSYMASLGNNKVV